MDADVALKFGRLVSIKKKNSVVVTSGVEDKMEAVGQALLNTLAEFGLRLSTGHQCDVTLFNPARRQAAVTDEMLEPFQPDDSGFGSQAPAFVELCATASTESDAYYNVVEQFAL
jgi:hypothetical protein